MKRELGISMRGEFRLRLYRTDDLKKVRASLGLPIEDNLDAPILTPELYKALDDVAFYDSGLKQNVITDLGRLRLLDTTWASGLKLFISQNTNTPSVDMKMLQFPYTQAAAQVLTPSLATNDLDLLLQTRSVTFPDPVTSARTIQSVGLCNASSVPIDVMAYTKLDVPTVQNPGTTADLQHRVAWSFN